VPNPLCHFELMTNNTQAAQAFYGRVFDWRFDDASMPGYTLVNTGAEPTGGIFAKPPDAPGVCINIYFHVDDVDAVLKKATQHGATTLSPKTAIAGVGEFAVLADPEGIAIGLFKPAGE